MRFPSECYQIHQTIRQTMPHLSEAQLKGLALRRSEPSSGRMWRRARLPPEPWPPPPDGVKVVCHPEIRNLPL